MTTAKDVRAQLIDALRLDLIGPRSGEASGGRYAEERLPIAPSKWYLTGFLVPFETSSDDRGDPDGAETLDEVGRKVEADDDTPPEAAAATRAIFPSSIGLSVLVSAETTHLEVQVAWADYVVVPKAGQAEASADEGDGAAPPEERAGRGRWRRIPREAEVRVLIADGTLSPVGLPGFEDLHVVVSVRTVGDHGLVPRGTRSVSVFLVNRRPPAGDTQRDAAYVFQPELSLHTEPPFVARPDLHGQGSDDADEKIADLQYKDVVEYAVGHNIAAVAAKGADNHCREVRTEWMPTAEVEKVVPRALPEVELGMEALANAGTPREIRDRVGPLLTAYDAWLEGQRASRTNEAGRIDVADGLLANGQRVHGRIQAGLDALETDALVFDAFRIANRAIATAIRQRLSHDKKDTPPESHRPPTWHPFQLAFVLMNLVGTAEATHADRKVVDLLFFPTGGGKTEAYLGLAAFVIVLRRLRDPSIQSSGVSVLMRYTLRLLTLDQLGRAATMICALELERQQDVSKLGAWPFEIGLWVGQSATPNRMGSKAVHDDHSARKRTIDFQNDSNRRASPIPLENCPWCGWRFTKDSFKLLPDSNEPIDLRVMCVNRACAFHGRKQPNGVPILSVDDPIYRRLPAFIIATVDKFANLPWVGETAGLFGRVERHDKDGFYGPTKASTGTPLKGPLPPPDLVIQDELHLISGPLGTMVGLYEAAIDALASTSFDADVARPKIVASTATVRRAERQIRALFGRSAVEVFPPPGPDRKDSFFAVTVGADKKNPRCRLSWPFLFFSLAVFRTWSLRKVSH